MKKHFYSVVVLLLVACVAHTQILNETFSATFPPTDWTRFLSNTAGISNFNNWTSVTVSFPPAPTDYAAYASGQGPGSVVVSEKYLVTPKLKPVAGSNVISFKLKREGTPVPLYAKYLVKVSTQSNNTATDFTTVATFTEGFTTNVTTTFQTFTVNLSAYDNQDIYVAFVWNGNGDNGCYLDDVTGIPLSGGIFSLGIVNFTAQTRDNQVALQWKLASTSTNQSLDIEHSTTGYKWKTIATLNGHNITGYVDRTPARGRNYYRLAKKETNGKVTYSEVRSATIGSTLDKIGFIYPNPVSQQFNIDLGHWPAEKVTYTITDALGRVVSTGVIASKQTTISAEKMTKGIYSIRLSDGQVFSIKR